MNYIFIELAGVLLAAGAIAYVLHFLRQPSIIAYIITGLLIGPLGVYHLQHGEILHGLSDIGITLLLFMVGLDLDISQLKRIGKAAAIAGIGQVVFTCLIGVGLIRLLGFDSLTAWYMAIAVTFSSTIIVVKLLNEKRDLQSLYGKLAVGIFLIQDVAAIFILILLSGLTGNVGSDLLGSGIQSSIVMTLAKAFMIAVIVIALSRTVFPRIITTIGKSDELLLIFGLAWSLGLAAAFTLPIIGFNAAIGGFVAGLALANTGVHHQISGRVKSLRDFFVILFFIVLGSQLVIGNFAQAIVPAVILSLFVLVGKPLIVTTLLGLMGYKPRTSFIAGVTLAQISEFSLILMTLGLSLGHVSEHAVTVVALVAMITIALSSYGILFAEKLYNVLHSYLQVFNFRKTNVEHELENVHLTHHIILIGAHRLGHHIIEALQKQKLAFVIVDFNPDIAAHYHRLGMHTICGDITDPYIQEVVRLSEARLVISTVPDFSDTMSLIETVKQTRKHIKLIVAGQDETEATQLYHAGAHYVLLPHFIGGLHLADIVRADQKQGNLRKLKEQHLKTLREVLNG